MSDAITQEILDELHNIEQTEQVKIFYACESGSRAWGFASQNSDYDVRFIYAHNTDFYLSIDDKRDVIEKPISGLLDINGWDIRKALRLFRKSNPTLLEWLQSPIVYTEQTTVAQQIRDLEPAFFSPKTTMYHYWSMAQGNFKHHLLGEKVKIKKYFYVIRPVLACRWIEQHNSVPPIEFSTLVKAMLPAGALTDTVNELQTRKEAGNELDPEPRLPIIIDFLEAELKRLANTLQNLPDSPTGDTALLDTLFRRAILEV